MAVLVPSQSIEVNQFRNKLFTGLNPGGIFYNQVAASASLTNSTSETSILNLAGTGTQGQLYLPAGILQYGRFTETPNLPGVILRLRLMGTLANTATPTLRIRATFTDSAGNVTTAVDTTALTTATITGTGYFDVDFQIQVQVYGTSGSFLGWGTVGSQTTSGAAIQAFRATPTVVSSFDTTKSYTLDVKATWGAASASNTLAVLGAYFEMIG